MSYLDIAKQLIRQHEGVRNKPYKDTVGKLTIGVGRNLDDVGISDAEIEVLLENDLKRAETDARAYYPKFDTLSDNRKAVLVDMSFNLGLTRLSEFKLLRAAMLRGDFKTASNQMMNSVWANQVKGRATRLAGLMRNG